MEQSIEDLKLEATELGISFKENISAEVLSKRIKDFYAAAEAKAAEEAEEASSAGETESEYKQRKVDAKAAFRVKAKASEAAARATRIVTIIDNDQRQNNQTTTCVVNCSCAYYDLGTRVIPLNEKVEVAIGHLNVLKEVQILRHMKNSRDPSISRQVLVSRYTIQYEDGQ